ncbi:hypothetical protein EGW08_018096 [Elysia chlorotica]|uniref:Reverse transcriptase domain-containing protein n=1 Tax=Elysia chlorotica TaxID=188477 RepID=A0A3S1H891_ELYCH|nr:hypothetical protein EGW08_018096 [Elysia chlorotica]
MVVDWVMQKSASGQNTSIQWTFMRPLEDLDFADDISLLSQRQQDAQEKLYHLSEEAGKTGLQINIGRAEVMRINKTIRPTAAASGNHQRETCRDTKTDSHKLQSFTNRCLRNILNVRRPDVIQNKEIWDRTKQTPIETETRKRKWGWMGHTLQEPVSNITRQSIEWNPQGKRKVGSLRQTWCRSTDAKIEVAGSTWAKLKRASQNQVQWRRFAATICSTEIQEA